jgi:uncharacterized protein YndB with AHSA1/START domain
MIPDAIEKEILINAPAETVYRVITEPGQIAQWFSDAASLEAIPGGAGVLTFEDRATSQRMAVKLVVEAAEAPHRFAFRWDYPDGEQPDEGNSLLVEFTLVPEGAGTRVRVTESGFTALRRPAQDKAGYYEAHDKGWDAHLASLQNYVASQS